MSKGLIAGLIVTFQIVVLLIIYNSLLDSPIAENPQAKAVLEIGQKTTIDAYNLWNLVEDIGKILTIATIIFGLIYAVIKIVEKESNSEQFYG